MFIPLAEFAQLAGLSERAARKVARLAAGGALWRGAKLLVRTVHARGGAAGRRWEVLVDSLPLQLKRRRSELLDGRSLASASIALGTRGAMAWSPEEREARHDAFTKLPAASQKKALRAAKAVQAFRAFDGTDVLIGARNAEAAKQAGVSKESVALYVKKCAGHDPGDWHVVLAPDYKPNPPHALFSEDAQQFFKSEYFVLTEPKLKPIYWRALRIAPQRSWSVPSYSTVKRWINTAFPHWFHVLHRKGQKAFERLYPPQQRDYSNLALHEMWCSDGWKCDFWVRWEDGTVDRPIIMSWIELRSRVAFDPEIGHTESADLVRRSFRAAVLQAKALPRSVLLDNGRAYASYEVSGGAPNRFRNQINESDPVGFLVLSGIDITWTQPGNAGAKPIESWHRTLAEMARRFPGAYCGNKPDAKPEDADRANAAPIADVRKVLRQTFADYNARAHRGDSMEGRAPMDVYRSMIEAPRTVVKRPTAAQLRVLLQAAVEVKLDPRDHSVTVLGNRYWAPQLAELPDGRFYAARYNPDDARDPISLYEGSKYLLDVPLVERTGFRDRDKAREHAREKRRFMNSLKERDAAISGMRGSRQWLSSSDIPTDEPPATAELPVSKVVQPLQLPQGFMPTLVDDRQRRKEAAERARADIAQLYCRKAGGT